MNYETEGTKCSECGYVVTKEDIQEDKLNDPERFFKMKCPSCGWDAGQEAMEKWNSL